MCREVVLRRSRPDWDIIDDINEMAEDINADLVVMGTNALGIGKEKLGSLGYR